ncbi:MAG: hypothetical protein M0Q21_07795 [Ignavibacteriaceae bacterium]|nr:hypothetical protein [Ignavibacteriaceae bacterium]
MWWEFVYEPTTLFSLKASEATNAAGKALLCPSPYAVKMAILNAVCTYDSTETAIQYFDLIKSLKMEFALPEYIVVNNCFLRIMQESRSETRKENPNIMFKSTVAFREYLYLPGEMKIAISSEALMEQQNLDFIRKYLAKINYFGKRGCFFQLKSFSDNPIDELSKEYSREIMDKNYFTDGRSKVLNKVDDFGAKATFGKVNNFSNEKTERISKIICLPFKVIKSNKNFTLLQRT